MTTSTRVFAVLASGTGSNFEALVRAAGRGELGGRVALLATDEPAAPAVGRAQRLGIEALVLPAGRFRTRLEDERPWVEALQARGVDTILLAGFMRRLHAEFLSAFPEHVFNIHPSLLPAFPGLDAIGQAWRHGARVTGCTVHVVDAELDAGVIVGQSAVDVRDDDTLATLTERVHEAEHRLYASCVRRYCCDAWLRDGRRILFGADPATERGAARVG